MDPQQLSLRDQSSDPRRAFRAKRGDVRLAILSLLNTESATGYRLMQLIRERSGGVWRVSAGSVYPTLDSLRSSRLVEESYVDGNSTYSITPEGRKLLSSKQAEVQRIWNFAETKDLRGLNPLEQELAKLSEAINLAAKSNNRVISLVHQDVVDFRKRIFKYLSE